MVFPGSKELLLLTQKKKDVKKRLIGGCTAQTSEKKIINSLNDKCECELVGELTNAPILYLRFKKH